MSDTGAVELKLEEIDRVTEGCWGRLDNLVSAIADACGVELNPWGVEETTIAEAGGRSKDAVGPNRGARPADRASTSVDDGRVGE